FSRIDAGGVLVMKLYERSEYTVTTTGMMRPSSFAVFALKFLQKSMMLTPWGPSAVPTGGAGVAFPAAIWSFTIAWTFFAMCLSCGLRPAASGLLDFPKPGVRDLEPRYIFSTCRKS